MKEKVRIHGTQCPKSTNEMHLREFIFLYAHLTCYALNLKAGEIRQHSTTRTRHYWQLKWQRQDRAIRRHKYGCASQKNNCPRKETEKRRLEFRKWQPNEGEGNERRSTIASSRRSSRSVLKRYTHILTHTKIKNLEHTLTLSSSTRDNGRITVLREAADTAPVKPLECVAHFGPERAPQEVLVAPWKVWHWGIWKKNKEKQSSEFVSPAASLAKVRSPPCH